LVDREEQKNVGTRSSAELPIGKGIGCINVLLFNYYFFGFLILGSERE